jgi:deoxyribonuclease V
VKPLVRTNWRLTPREAVRLQEELRDQVVLEDRFENIRSVAGADLAFNPETDEAVAGVVVYRLPELEEVERRKAWRTLKFPYIPGLLSFRESPVLLAAFAKLRNEPDLIIIDGHGRAHPRLFGIACHIGVLFDKPTIGCAKSLLVCDYEEPALEAGSSAPLLARGQQLGVVLRSRHGVKPIFVTQGHRVALSTALEFVQLCLDGFRIPKPTREADHYVRELRRLGRVGKIRAGPGEPYRK